MKRTNLFTFLSILLATALMPQTIVGQTNQRPSGFSVQRAQQSSVSAPKARTAQQQKKKPEQKVKSVQLAAEKARVSERLEQVKLQKLGLRHKLWWDTDVSTDGYTENEKLIAIYTTKVSSKQEQLCEALEKYLSLLNLKNKEVAHMRELVQAYKKKYLDELNDVLSKEKKFHKARNESIPKKMLAQDLYLKSLRQAVKSIKKEEEMEKQLEKLP